MGYRHDYDINSIYHQLYMANVEMNKPRNDGFVTWGIKQDLYKIKFLMDHIMNNAPTYVDEAEWLEEQSKKEMWKILKNDI